MNPWYEIVVNLNNLDQVIKFEVLDHENITDKMHLEIQDASFAHILYECLKKDNDIHQALILAKYNINLTDSYEDMKLKVVPLSDAKLCHVKYLKEIYPCEGCCYKSGNQNDHMGYNGCLT